MGESLLQFVYLRPYLKNNSASLVSKGTQKVNLFLSVSLMVDDPVEKRINPLRHKTIEDFKMERTGIQRLE